MTDNVFEYSKVKENFFTQKELRALATSLGIDNITQKALDVLGTYISDLGRVLTLLVLSQNDGGEIEEHHVTQAFSNIGLYQPPSIYYIWIISDNGTCLYSKSLSIMEFPDAIFAGMLVGMLVMTRELTGRNLERFDMQDLAIYMNEQFGIIGAIVSKRTSDAQELNRFLLNEFISKFKKEILETGVDLNIFRSFDKVLHAVIRDWYFISKRTKKSTNKHILVEADSIEEEILSDYKKEDLESAMKEITQLEIFKKMEEPSENLEKILEKKFRFNGRDKLNLRFDLNQLAKEVEDSDTGSE